MSADRKAIRLAIQSLLKTGSPTRAAGRVYTSRADRLRDAQVPAINIWARGEDATMTGTEYQFEVTVFVELHVMQAATDPKPDDEIDDFAAEVNALLIRNPTLVTPNPPVDSERGAGAASWGEYRRTDFDVDEEGEKLEGAARITWLYRYYSPAEEEKPADLSEPSETRVDVDQVPADGVLDTHDRF